MKRWITSCALSLALFCGAAHAQFVAKPARYESKEFRAVAKELDGAGVLREIAVALNDTVDIPVELGLRFAECGEANAYYDSSVPEVLLCFELITSYYESLADTYETEKELDDAVTNAFLFVFFHEIGHALVDVLELPITGREEDAVDQLSAWVLIDNDEGDQAVLDGALSFYVSEDETDDDTDFSDEHSFNKQRYYNMVCWVYGSDPKKYEYLVGETEEDWLPQARADRCEDEYAQLDRAWTKLLDAHVKADEAEETPQARSPKRGSTVGKVTPYRSE
jgi:hypothetical protein